MVVLWLYNHYFGYGEFVINVEHVTIYDRNVMRIHLKINFDLLFSGFFPDVARLKINDYSWPEKAIKSHLRAI